MGVLGKVEVVDWVNIPKKVDKPEKKKETALHKEDDFNKECPAFIDPEFPCFKCQFKFECQYYYDPEHEDPEGTLVYVDPRLGWWLY